MVELALKLEGHSEKADLHQGCWEIMSVAQQLGLFSKIQTAQSVQGLNV